MSGSIENQVELKASISKVWQALTDYKEFSQWFGVKLEGPFVVGEVSQGHITYPGYEHIKLQAAVQKMESERLFSLTWHPYAINPKKDYSKETPTLVQFKLEKTKNGTLVTVTESGFEKLPTKRRNEAFHMNEEGWKIQMENIKKHIADFPK